MLNRTGFKAALKEVFVAEEIQDSVFAKTKLLEMFKKVTPVASHGSEAIIVVRLGLSNGYSAVPNTGSSELNPAGGVSTARATHQFSHNWQNVEIDAGVILESKGSDAIATAVVTEKQAVVDGLSTQLERALFADGTAKITATRATEAASTTIPLSLTDGYDALRRRHLAVGMTVDIGTAADEDAIAASREITAVSVDAENPTITISGEEVETTTSHFVSVANARSGETSYELDGLDAMFSDEAKYGGIDPESEPEWAAYVDSTEQDISLALINELEDEAWQSSGDEPTDCITSGKQLNALMELLQSQARFNGGESYNTGKRSGLTLPSGVEVMRHQHCYSGKLYMIHKSDLGTVRHDDGPMWAKQMVEGDSSPLDYVPDTTRFKGAMTMPFNTCLLRRNSHSAATALK